MCIYAKGVDKITLKMWQHHVSNQEYGQLFVMLCLIKCHFK